MSYQGTREAFSAAMEDYAKQHPETVLISADSMLAARASGYAERLPHQFVEVGIAEQCAVDVAVGMAATGMNPVVATYAGFITMRACEQVRTFVAYPGLNVKMAGFNSGMIGGEREGVTHQFYEDIAIIRAMKGIDIICPSDANSAYDATLAMLASPRACYLRLGNGKEKDVLWEKGAFVPGKVHVRVSYGKMAVLFTHGFVLPTALKAAKQLHEQGIDITVVEVHTLTPLDEEGILTWLAQCPVAICYEDHYIYGGLGSAVAQLSAERANKRVLCMGLRGFAESGTPSSLLHKYQLDEQSVMQVIKQAL